MEWTKACGLAELKEGEPRIAGGAVLVKQGDRINACGLRCPHMGYPMVNGAVRNGVITCAWHKWEFDLTHGGCYRGACDDLPVYPVEVRDGVVFVAKPEQTGEKDQHARRLRDGLMTGDIYLQARGLAGMLDEGGDVDKAVAVALDHSFQHSIGAHASAQAVREAAAIFNAGRLAKSLEPKRRVTALLQGVRTASGPVGDRPAVALLPGHCDTVVLMKRMEQYVFDSSVLGLERIFLTLNDQGMAAEDLAKAMLDLASRSWFAVDPDAFVNVVNAIEIGIRTRRMDRACTWVAWVLGQSRPQPDLDSKDAMDWLNRHAAELVGIKAGANPASSDDVTALLGVNQLTTLFDRVQGWLRSGISIESLVNAISLVCARRVDRLWLNNGGMWGDAVRGLRLCHAWRRASAITEGPHTVQSLFLLIYYLFESRWLQAGHAWKRESPVVGDWEAYEAAFRALDVKRARAVSMGLLRQEGRDQSWPRWIGPLMEEDLSALQVEVLMAALAESAHQDEWEPYLAGMITYTMDNKAGQDVLAAATFGLSV